MKGDRARQQANYINALAVSISPIFEPAGPTLGELFFPPWVNFFMTLGELSNLAIADTAVIYSCK
jgi:hypothetical protein